MEINRQICVTNAIVIPNIFNTEDHRHKLRFSMQKDNLTTIVIESHQIFSTSYKINLHVTDTMRSGKYKSHMVEILN